MKRALFILASIFVMGCETEPFVFSNPSKFSDKV